MDIIQFLEAAIAYSDSSLLVIIIVNVNSQKVAAHAEDILTDSLACRSSGQK